MISVFTVKFRRIFLAFFFIVQFLVVLFYLRKINSGESFVNKGKDLLENLRTSPSWGQENKELDDHGYILNKGDVKFKFTNPKEKPNQKESVLKSNGEVYKKFVLEEITEPLDIDLESIRPPSSDELSDYARANGTIISLVRNSEVLALSRTIKSFEASFNHKFRYPYIFLNDKPFSTRFKNRVRALSKAEMHFITIPEELWNKPDFIDLAKEREAMDKLSKKNIAYAKLGSYHNMCRFYSGNIFNIPELKKYKYYWRIEPDVKFYTDLKYDIFKYMELKEKVYGFTISLYDIAESIETLWPETLNFLNQDDNYKYVKPSRAIQWLLENKQNPDKNRIAHGYSTCHFWSNFEIVDMDFFRSEAYTKWFNYLDSTGKFYYERWGDAPVHSIGLALFADPSQIHWFRDIGYYHDPYYNCANSPNTKNCEAAKFSKWKHLEDQNCMPAWIEYVMDNKDTAYALRD